MTTEPTSNSTSPTAQTDAPPDLLAEAINLRRHIVRAIVTGQTPGPGFMRDLQQAMRAITLAAMGDDDGARGIIDRLAERYNQAQHNHD